MPEMEVVAPIPPVPPVTPAVNQPIKFKRLFLPAAAAVTVILLIGLALGTYLLGKNKWSAPTPKLFATRLSTTPPATDPTANWKTYTNTKYGFSFRYPANWRSYEETARDERFLVHLTDLTTEQQKQTEEEKPMFQTSIADFVVSKLQDNISLRDYVLENHYNCYNLTDKDREMCLRANQLDLNFAIGGRAAATVDGPGQAGNWYTAITTYAGYVLEGTIRYWPGNREDEVNKKTFDQILSTFKFVDQNTE